MQGVSASVSKALPTMPVDAAWIADRLAAILDLDSVAPDDDFFVLGGDSTAAVALMSEIEARTGAKLGISLLLKAPTPARLAALIASGTAECHPLLLPVQDTGDGVPLFLIHGLLGQVFLARYLRGRLGSRAIWGIQAAKQDPEVAAPRTVEELAVEYIAAIRSVRPSGPYLIGGYCAGTFVAWEIARRLMDEGERIPIVFAIDPPPVIGDYIGGQLPATGLGPMADERFLAKARLDIRRTAAHHADFHWIRNDPVAQREAVATAAALRHAFLAYRPEPCAIPVVFLCSRNKARLVRLPDSPWRWLTGGEPVVAKLAHRHSDLFIPEDPTLAAAIKQAIEERGF
jgi:thioesterase domain-containing protein/acyl carrier protein